MEKHRLTDLPCTISERIFTAGEEPTGVRVTPYHKQFGIKQILNALEPEEIEKRASPFGKFVELADKPSFSGRFGRYIISRQLNVAKKHEAWFKRSKKRLANRNIIEKPYWGELFGTLKEVPVASVIRMLKKKTVRGEDLRLIFFRCAVHGFSSWFDEEDPHGWQKTSLLEAREQIDRQRSEIEKLESHIMVLHQQRSSLPTVSGDNF
ncbi:hypothetical protein F2Q69_00012723 [Brassica cretica]|uniref:DUF7900 domain-containing protein n=1 Tax=Brassica cretica TaxID=69181 RepID=A0A8S9QYY3_BRACR|nr:hypothetical protein F2Q69_00012723 [Brassica cretica]